MSGLTKVLSMIHKPQLLAIAVATCYYAITYLCEVLNLIKLIELFLGEHASAVLMCSYFFLSFFLLGVLMLLVLTFCREPASSASGRAASGMSSDEKNQVLLEGAVLVFF